MAWATVKSQSQKNIQFVGWLALTKSCQSRFVFYHIEDLKNFLVYTDQRAELVREVDTLQ